MTGIKYKLRFVKTISRLSIIIFLLGTITTQTSALAQPACPCSDFISGTDINCDGLTLSVADMVLLIRVINGDTLVSDSCISELDGYHNSFAPCKPNIGDAIAYARYFAYGLPAAPVFDCNNLMHLQYSPVELTMSPVISFSGIGSSRNTVKLRNNGPDSAFIWGLTIPLNLEISGRSPESLSIVIDTVAASGSWDSSVKFLDSTQIYLTFRSSQSGQAIPTAIAPNEEIELFAITLDWFSVGVTTITPELTSDSAFASPIIVSGYENDPLVPPRTEILSLVYDNCCTKIGDVNRDGRFNISDVVFLIGTIFQGSTFPECPGAADINGDLTFNIEDVTAGITHIFVTALPYGCSECSFSGVGDVDYLGDVNLNGISYEIADAITIAYGLIRRDDHFGSTRLARLAASDVDMDCAPMTVGDYIQMWQVTSGENRTGQPRFVSHYAQTAQLSYIGDVLSVDVEVKAILLTFPGDVTVELLATDMSWGSEYDGSVTRVLIDGATYWSGNTPKVVSGDLLRVDRVPIKVQAANTLGALYRVEF